MFKMKIDRLYFAFACSCKPLVNRLAVAGRPACPYDPQSYAGGSLVLLAGLTMPDWSVGEGTDKTTPWSSRLGVGREASNATP